MLLVEPLTLEHAARFAQHLKEKMKEPFVFAGRTIVSRASSALQLFPTTTMIRRS